MISAPNLADLDWIVHGFGERDAYYPYGIRLAKQIHSAIVLDAAGAMEPPCEGDALISNQPGTLIGVKTADCVPILLADPEARAVAAVHAGWRGAAGSIVTEAVQAMGRKYGSRPASIRAAIGPGIGPCCYEVGPEVACRFGIDSAKPVHLDLPSLNEAQLRGCGVGNIWKSDDCTFCGAERFFSFRREKEKAGRQISWIGIGHAKKQIGRTPQGPPGNTSDVG